MGGFLLLVLLLAAVVGLVALGYWLAKDKLAAEQAELDTRGQIIQAEWMRLENTQRIHNTFMQARDQLRRAEADANAPRWPCSHPSVVDGDWTES